ncbi:exodeoxyribonuclease III [Rarobacter incanus]|uniref:Exodeoxyribonuclease III n=1 Tax=Rarobacter incanus TaxID=153494 RepID=A0A542SRI0_9MICO|nr:exodeoxyribonuclease III [Rarobacter incanus]TQK76827.1 exodeoxyribonuclease III [Rarobacter incanus]
MRIATWNINSVRSRIDRALALLEREDLDVLALQETKVKDAAFPTAPFLEAGYQVAHTGHSQWNGVAVISRVGIADVETHFAGQPPFGDPAAIEARALGATCAGIRVWSLYVPNGREVTDPHYAYKLEWLSQLQAASAGWLAADPSARIALMGDWNVAPLDTDVWDPSFFTGKTHLTAPERDAFAAIERGGYQEITRRFLPAEHTYTYWDYQRLSFPKNSGMRIDFAYVSPALAQQTAGVTILRDERKGKGASDHVPVILDIQD